MVCPYVSGAAGVDLAAFPQLQPGLSAYRTAVRVDRRVDRQHCVGTLARAFRTLSKQHRFDVVGATILSLSSVDAEEILRFVRWVPAEPQLYLTLCSHPDMSDLGRSQLLQRAHYEMPEAESPSFEQHLRAYHPLAVAFCQARKNGFAFWDAETCNQLCAQLYANPLLMHVSASLLTTWVGNAEELLETARGIMTTPTR